MISHLAFSCNFQSVSSAKDVSQLFAAVVKNVVSKNTEIKKLVYVYLVRYAEEQQDLALLSISTFQKGLKVGVTAVVEFLLNLYLKIQPNIEYVQCDKSVCAIYTNYSILNWWDQIFENFQGKSRN